jgi:hypothetical protein
VFITEAVLASGALIGLNQLGIPITQSEFHFINDNADWLQMDKVGHFIPHQIGSLVKCSNGAEPQKRVN